MNRKDLIIIAVLVNAGLMTVFFISALKSSNADEIALESSHAPASQVQEMKIAQATPADEIDQVLRDHHSASSTAAAMPMSPVMTQAAQTPASAAPSFADDLKAITMPEINAQPQNAAPLVAQGEKAAPAFTEVKVKKGDVLEKIARKHGVTVEEVMKFNHLTSSRLNIGQMLKIPGKTPVSVTATTTPKKEQPVQSNDGEAQYYTVKNGDNPWTIAVKHHMKVEDLLKLNNMSEEKARRLKAGDKLRIK